MIKMKALNYLIGREIEGGFLSGSAFVVEMGRGWLSLICYMRMIPFSFVGQIKIK